MGFGTAFTAGHFGDIWNNHGPSCSPVGSLTTRYATAPCEGFVPGLACAGRLGQNGVVVSKSPSMCDQGSDEVPAVAVRQSMPEPGKLVGDRLAYHIRAGKHAMLPEDWDTFLAFADKHLKTK